MRVRRDVLVVVLLIALTAVYILCFPTRHFSADATNRLEFTEGYNLFELWHSQHLLAQLPGYVAYLALDTRLRAYQAIQLIDALMCGLTAAALYGAARSLGAKWGVALAAGLAIWFSYGFWHYASDPDVYSPVILAAALLMLALIRYLNGPTDARMIVLGAAAALALLMHQMNVELIGLIGLALLIGTAGLWNFPKIPLRHVILYGALIAVIVPLVYVIGWRSASAYMEQTTGTTLSFLGYVGRYFNIASTGQASWGQTLHLNTLPEVGYTMLKSWTLPPLRSQITLLDVLLIGGLMASAAFWFVYGLVSLRSFVAVARIVALICLGTQIINTASAWWWQAGNIKFYLPMQINVIVLVVACVIHAHGSRSVLRWAAYVAVSVSLACLVLLHLKNSLSYETRGGVFVVAAEMVTYTGSGMLTAQFADATQARILPLISPYNASVLAAEFCTEPMSEPVWLVLGDVPQGDCPALESQFHTEDYQADVSRQVWKVYAPKAAGIGGG